MSFLIIPDLHGRMPLISTKKFDAIIAVGDFCDDRKIGPIIKKWFKYLKNNESISLDEFREMTEGKKKIKQHDKESVFVGRKVLERLNSFGKPVFIVPGNWDESFGDSKVAEKYRNPSKYPFGYVKCFLEMFLGGRVDSRLIKGLKNIYDCQYKLHKFPKFNIVGYGLSSAPEAPSFWAKKKLKTKIAQRHYEGAKKAYKKIILKLDNEYKKRNRRNPTIFLTHNVPYMAGKLDKIISKESHAHGKHYGSTVARNFCMRHRPLICIGGHIHEHFGKVKLGKTTVINAGYGSKKNVILDIKGNRISKLEFIDRSKK